MKKFLWFLALFSGLTVKAENLISLDFQRNTLSNGFSLGLEKKVNKWGFYGGVRYQTTILPYNTIDSELFVRRLRPEKFIQALAPNVSVRRYFNQISNTFIQPFVEASALYMTSERFEYSLRFVDAKNGVTYYDFFRGKTGQKAQTTDFRFVFGFRHDSSPKIKWDFALGYAIQRISVGEKTNQPFCIDPGVYWKNSIQFNVGIKYVL